MEIQISLPVDNDGFLRRECPNCERQFKWFYGKTADRPNDFLEPENYFCPYCAEPAAHDSWWTPRQLEYMRDAATGPVLEEVADELRRSLGGVKSGFVKFEINQPDLPEPPMPLTEPNDMVMVEPPCHPFEPLKVDERWNAPLVCLMCGEQFTI